MKFYNPFKPHIVEFTDGTFAVRKSSLVYWSYYSKRCVEWWSCEEYVQKYCRVDTLEEAKSVLNRCTLEVKVIHEA